MRRCLLLRAAPLWALLASACASLPPVDRQQAEAGWAAHRQEVSAIRSFELRARIAGSALGAKADVLWQQAADDSFRIHVSGPFGAGSMRLRGDARQVEVVTAEGSFVTDNPERWLQEHLGWTLPIAGLRWWALGLPAPHSTAEIELDASGKLAGLQQDGWQLRYDSYTTAGPWQLPHRFEAGNGSASLRVIADRWAPDSAE